MILIDVTTISSLLLEGPRSTAARRALSRDMDWISVPIWHHQFLEILVEHVRLRQLSIAEALEKLVVASFAIRNSHEALDNAAILRLANEVGISASQATLILVARRLGARLVTADSQIVTLFPADAVAVELFSTE